MSVEIHNNSSLSSGSRYWKPEVISWWKINITVFYTRFISPTGQQCVESSAFWQFFYYFPTSKFRYTAGEIVKIWCQEFDIYQYIYIYIYIYIYNITLSISNMDFLYQFNLGLHHFWGFFPMLKNVFQKLAGLWLVGEVVNHVELYWFKVAEGCSAFQRRSCIISQPRLNPFCERYCGILIYNHDITYIIYNGVMKML